MSMSLSAIFTAGPPEVTNARSRGPRCVELSASRSMSGRSDDLEQRGQCVAIDPVGRVVDGAGQLGGRSAVRSCIERIVERDRDRVDIRA